MNTTTGAYISPYADWKSPNFLVVSCGANYIDLGDGIMPAQNEYWDVTTLTGGVNMMKNGIIPANYFEDDPAPTTGHDRRRKRCSAPWHEPASPRPECR